MHFIMFSLHAISLYALILIWQRMAVNLRAAHKKTDSHAFYYPAVHKVWLIYNTLSLTWQMRAAHS